MTRGPWLAEPNEIVQIHGQTTYDGQLAEVVQRVRRRRNHRTTTTRYDYRLRVGTGQILWFSDAEIQPYQVQNSQRGPVKGRAVTDQLFTVPPKLTERQQWVYDLLATQPGSPLEVGAMLHRWQGCRFCTADEPCQYAENAGREVLEALRKKGLVRRDRHQVYRRVDGTSEPSSQLADTDPFPAGF